METAREKQQLPSFNDTWTRVDPEARNAAHELAVLSANVSRWLSGAPTRQSAKTAAASVNQLRELIERLNDSLD